MLFIGPPEAQANARYVDLNSELIAVVDRASACRAIEMIVELPPEIVEAAGLLRRHFRLLCVAQGRIIGASGQDEHHRVRAPARYLRGCDMPNEFSFDDLDLREEPALSWKPSDSHKFATHTIGTSGACTRTQECTLTCTDACC